MLAISPLRSHNKDENHREEGSTTMEASFGVGGDDNMDFSGANLLDSIDFDDLFMGMHESDVLPDLEMDPELLAEFSISGKDDNNSSTTMSLENVSPNINFGDSNVNYVVDGHQTSEYIDKGVKLERVKYKGKSDLTRKKPSEEVEIESKKKDLDSTNSLSIDNEKTKKHKPSSSSNTLSNKTSENINNQGKRKTKVDWTPELHRRFVQAVEQLGVDKAVPSRILELMGIDCLTRHNIASHLQKYRSHRKHLLAREAEAANWTQKRQMYGMTMGGGKGGVNISPWHPPTIGFPPPMTPMHHSIRPLHVWGHPTMDPQARIMSIWPKHAAPSPSPLTPVWTPPSHPPPANPSFWHGHTPHHRRLAVAPATGIPPHAMYRPEHGVPPPLALQNGPHPPVDLYLSKECIDSAIGDVLSKPWLPLPIGLKPPSMDSVLGELQRQGVSKIPPSCT